MHFYIDTADLDEIKKANSLGWLDGVTTNPSLVAKTGDRHHDLIKRICQEVKGPVSAEVLSTKAEEIYKEGMKLSELSEHVVVKVPMTEDGLIAAKRFSQQGIKTNITLVFSPLQALCAAKVGATYVSPFVGRLDDIALSGMSIVEDIVSIYKNYSFTTKILVASIRNPIHILKAAKYGADIVSLPYKVLRQITKHPLTDSGLAKFLEDARKIPKE